MFAKYFLTFAFLFVLQAPAFGLTPPPPVEVPLYIGTSACPASPSIIRDVYTDRSVNLIAGRCGVFPSRGTLVFSSSDPNAIFPANFTYDFTVVTIARSTLGKLPSVRRGSKRLPRATWRTTS
jgi:hypothetical protein